MSGILDDIGCRIKKFRQKSGYTQQQVANLLNIERSTYSYYESGKTVPDIKTLSKIAEIFNEPIVNFLEEEAPILRLSEPNCFDWAPSDFTFKVKNIKKEENENIIDAKDASNLSSHERQIIMCFRMLPSEAQKEISEIMENIIKNKSQRN